jgi:glycosyltransferase involved in cell wall biosynthesis
MIKVAEYMAACRPVVAYPLLETRRTAGGAVAYARCGDLESFADAVAMLAADPDRRMRLAREGHERARSLTWDASETRLLGAYQSLTVDS